MYHYLRASSPFPEGLSRQEGQTQSMFRWKEVLDCRQHSHLVEVGLLALASDLLLGGRVRERILRPPVAEGLLWGQNPGRGKSNTLVLWFYTCKWVMGPLN